jgi:hypothetical protein
VEVTTVIQTSPAAAAVETPAPVAAVATPAPVVEVAAVKQTEELPQTASSLPLLALLGGLSISLALGLKLFLKLAS